MLPSVRPVRSRRRLLWSRMRAPAPVSLVFAKRDSAFLAKPVSSAARIRTWTNPRQCSQTKNATNAQNIPTPTRKLKSTTWRGAGVSLGTTSGKRQTMPSTCVSLAPITLSSQPRETTLGACLAPPTLRRLTARPRSFLLWIVSVRKVLARAATGNLALNAKRISTKMRSAPNPVRRAPPEVQRTPQAQQARRTADV